MRHQFSGILALAVIIGWLATAPAMAMPTVTLELADAPAHVGDTFDVEVRVENSDIGIGLLAFGFDILFETGDIYEYNGYSLDSDAFLDVSYGNGNVSAAAYEAIYDDSVLLATLSLTALSAGMDRLYLIGLYDGAFSGLYYESSVTMDDGYHIVASMDMSTPVPLPPALLLLGSGLVGLVAKRRLQINAGGHP